MKNKSKKMYGKLSALLLSIVLMMSGLSATALAAGENLIDAFDPTFDSYVPAGTTPIPEGKETLPANNNLFTLNGATLDTNGGNSTSANCLAMTTSGAYVQFMAPVEPAKNYNLSFWMRNSVENALRLDKCTFKVKNYKGSAYFEMANGGTGDWDWLRSYYNGGFGGSTAMYGTYTIGDYMEYTFGAVRGENEQNAWRQVTINFSTPPEAVTHVQMLLWCVKDDAKLAVDDLSLVETGKKPNRVFNGDFEAIRNDQDTPDASGIAYKKAGVQTKIEEDSTGNHYLKVDLEGENRINWEVYSKTAAFLQGKNNGTRYKVSYKAKAVDKEGKTIVTAKPACIQLDINKGGEFRLGDITDKWKTFTMYIDHTMPAKNGHGSWTPITALVRYAYPNYTLYVDDVYSWYDETNIGFYETLDFYYKEGKLHYGTTVLGLEGYDDILMGESSTEAKSLAALKPDETTGNRTLKVRAHYLPEATWGTDEQGATTVSFDETTVTLLAAVYKYETKNGVETKTLVDVKAANGTSSINGETIDVVTEVSVPGNSAGVRYEVEAVALNMDSLKPIAEKAVLR